MNDRKRQPWWRNRNLIIILCLVLAAAAITAAGLANRSAGTVITPDSPVLDAGLPTMPPLGQSHSGSSGAPEAGDADEGTDEAAEASQTDIDWESALYLVVTIGHVTYQPIPMLREMDLPLDQGSGMVNTIHIHPGGAYMLSSTCDNQDCVQQGEVTRENMDERVLYNMVICLPHQLMFEVMTWEQLVQLYNGA